MAQIVFSGAGSRKDVSTFLQKSGAGKCLIVCNYAAEDQKLDDFLAKAGISYIYFTDFGSNPLYENVCHGISVYLSNKCDSIIAVGGGSAIDVAKCIKLYCKMDAGVNYLRQKCFDSGIPLIAVPTTAGTGSESTRFAVIYFEGQKQSITHESIIPNAVVLDAELLRSLPLYQKKCTMLDALCQGIESWWSVNSTEESKEYSKKAISGIINNMETYLANEDDLDSAQRIMDSANYAGRAINITQTTGPHAMSYKLTSLYHLPHGHAVAICLPKVWEYMLCHMDKCVDPRGIDYLTATFSEISALMGQPSSEESVEWFEHLLQRLEITRPHGCAADIEVLASSVNPVRLKNNPVMFNNEDFQSLYRKIVMEDTK